MLYVLVYMLVFFVCSLPFLALWGLIMWWLLDKKENDK